MKGIWNNSEVKTLFNSVEQCKLENKPLREAFAAHASKYNRRPNSVRNYYYHEIDNLKNDEERRKSLKIDMSQHEKAAISYFSDEEKEKVLREIDEKVESGMSLRKACYELSGGDAKEMLRYQNKYRNYLASLKKSKSAEIVQKLPKNDEKIENIVPFVRKTLTDSDIQSLFMGLVRLVKRNAKAEAEAQSRLELNRANNLLREVFKDISSKDRDITRLQAELDETKKKNATLTDTLMKMRCENLPRLKS